MLFITHSSDFEKVFLNNEYDKIILETQFVIVSTRIRKRTNANQNIVVGTNALFPEMGYFCLERGSEEARMEYFKQLNANKPFLSSLVKGSIEKGFNIFFICSDNEWKESGHLQLLREYIMETFYYPVYNYKKYVNGCPLYQYDEKYTLKICNSILKIVKRRSEEAARRSEKGRYAIMKKMKKKDKSKLIKRVKKIGLYRKGMGKDEMIDIIESFL